MLKIILSLFVLFNVFSAFSQTEASTSARVILWKLSQPTDPTFHQRANQELERQLHDLGNYTFIREDTLKVISESQLYTWPLRTQTLRDSLAELTQAKFQMEFQQGQFQKQQRRSTWYVTSEEEISYELKFKVLEADSTLYYGQVVVDTLVEQGWCGIKDCKIAQRNSQEEVKIKEHLLKKGIRLLLLDAQPFIGNKP